MSIVEASRAEGNSAQGDAAACPQHDEDLVATVAQYEKGQHYSCYTNTDTSPEDAARMLACLKAHFRSVNISPLGDGKSRYWISIWF